MPPKRKNQQPLLTSFFQKANKSADGPSRPVSALVDTSNKQSSQTTEAVKITVSRVEDATSSSSEPLENATAAVVGSGAAGPHGASVDQPWRTAEATAAHIEQQRRRKKRKLIRHANAYSSIWKHHQSTSRNVVHGLLRRSLFVRTLAPPPPQTYRLVNEEQLLNAGPTVHQFAWDAQGVLLAVTMGRGRIHVYDDLDARNIAAAEPLLAWTVARCNTPTVLLQFGTESQQEDELLMGVQAHRSLYVFDLRVVQGWVEDNRGARPPPYRELRIGEPIVHSASVCSVNSRVFLSSGTSVTAWCVTSPWEPGVITPMWKYTNHQVINSIRPSSDTIVCGTATGQFLVLDWKKVQTDSFGSNPHPTKVTEWTSRQSIHRILSYMSEPVRNATCLTVDGRISHDFSSSHATASRFRVHAVGTNGYDWVWCGRDLPLAAPVASDVRVLAASTSAPTETDVLTVWIRTGRGNIASYPLPNSIAAVKSITIDPERTCILLGTVSHGWLVLRESPLQQTVRGAA